MRYLTPYSLGILVSAAALLLVAVHATGVEGPGLARALADQEALVSDRSADPVAWNDLGNLLVLAAEPQQAENAYRRAIDLDPSFVLPRFNLALLLMQRGEARTARGELEAVVEHEPEHAWAHYQLGVLTEERGERAAAIDHYARAFALDQRLSFAENNPHIIDNGLMTASLLKAQRYIRGQTARQVPRQYGETNRIRDIILNVDPPTGDVSDEPSTEPAEGDAGSGFAPRARFDAPSSGDPDEEDDAVADTSSDNRVLSSDDLDASSRTGEVVGGTATSRARGGVLDRYRPPRATRPPTGSDARGTSPSQEELQKLRSGFLRQRGGTEADRQDEAERDRTERFRSSARSSAQLDLVLEPSTAAAGG